MKDNGFLKVGLAKLTRDWQRLRDLDTSDAVYETLVWMGKAERRVEPILDDGRRQRGSRTYYRLHP